MLTLFVWRWCLFLYMWINLLKYLEYTFIRSFWRIKLNNCPFHPLEKQATKYALKCDTLYSLARTSGPNILLVLAAGAVSGLEGKREVPEVCKWTSRSLIDSCYCDESNLRCLKLSENREVKIVLCRRIAKLQLALRWFSTSGDW